MSSLIEDDLEALCNEEQDSECPITPVAKQSALELLRLGGPVPSLCPDSDGGISMEWTNDEKILRVRATANGLNSYIYQRVKEGESSIHAFDIPNYKKMLSWVEESL